MSKINPKRMSIRKVNRRPKDESTDLKEPTSTMREIENKFLVMSYHADPKFICHCQICEKEFHAQLRKE